MRRPGTDRILVLTGICLVLIFLGFSYLAFNAVSSKELGREIVIGMKSEALASDDPFIAAVETRPLTDPLAEFAFTSKQLEFVPDSFFTNRELDGYRERRNKEALYRGIAPPLRLRWKQREKGILLEWSPNPRNDVIAADVRNNPSLRTGYRIYRWRVGETPTVIATGSLEQTSYLDQDLGPRGGQVFYSVVAVLEGRIGLRDTVTVIESESSDVVEIGLEDSFELRLIGGTTDRVTFEVVVGTGTNQYSARFEVGSGEAIGRLCQVSTVGGIGEVDFATGLTVVEIAEVEDVREEVVRHPVFNPDGSRSFDETGFLFREEAQNVPVKRLEVRCEGARGRSRTLSVDRP